MSSSLNAHKATAYKQHGNFTYSDAYTAPILNILNPREGERIIDLGCGTGEVTLKIAEAVGRDGKVFGVDSSASMLEKARTSSSGSEATSPITYLQADIQDLPKLLDPSLKGTFDAVFTSAVLHWCKRDPEGVIRGVKWLLKPGGRFAFELGGYGNGIGARMAMRHVLEKHGHDAEKLDPWWFPTEKHYARLLTSHGLSVPSIQLVPRPTPLNTDFYGWLTSFCRHSALADFDDETAEEYMREMVEMCRPDMYWSDPGAEEGEKKEGWMVMYIRLRGIALVQG